MNPSERNTKAVILLVGLVLTTTLYIPALLRLGNIRGTDILGLPMCTGILFLLGIVVVFWKNAFSNKTPRNQAIGKCVSLTAVSVPAACLILLCYPNERKMTLRTALYQSTEITVIPAGKKPVKVGSQKDYATITKNEKVFYVLTKDTYNKERLFACVDLQEGKNGFYNTEVTNKLNEAKLEIAYSGTISKKFLKKLPYYDTDLFPRYTQTTFQKKIDRFDQISPKKLNETLEPESAKL